jgi:hypothetical protein
LDALEADPVTKTYVDGQINSEAVARASADSVESAARIAADSAEAAARAAADSALDARLDILEADPVTKTYVDGQISSEATTRASADTALDGRVSALEAITWEKKKIVLSSTDISNQNIDLDHEVISATIVAFVGRLAIHESDDYGISVVGGKTRLSFQGDIASSGVSALSEGDVLYVSYAYDSSVVISSGVTELLLHFDGDYSDSSLSPKSPLYRSGAAGSVSSPNGPVFQNNGKFGSQSAYFDGGNFIQYSGDVANFGRHDFTIDFWIMQSVLVWLTLAG